MTDVDNLVRMAARFGRGHLLNKQWNE